MMHYYALLCTMMHYDALSCTIMHHHVLLCAMMHYYVLLCGIMHYNALLSLYPIRPFQTLTCAFLPPLNPPNLPTPPTPPPPTPYPLPTPYSPNLYTIKPILPTSHTPIKPIKPIKPTKPAQVRLQAQAIEVQWERSAIAEFLAEDRRHFQLAAGLAPAKQSAVAAKAVSGMSTGFGLLMGIGAGPLV
ncbi:hypothetical protein B484DRAFT_190796 [Ochromonadaceae sp. CCMP2298]|nr:hypothetical protein B484DRAFT_190796 [Ochromonadaceae sp. CCMP2298]